MCTYTILFKHIAELMGPWRTEVFKVGPGRHLLLFITIIVVNRKRDGPLHYVKRGHRHTDRCHSDSDFFPLQYLYLSTYTCYRLLLLLDFQRLMSMRGHVDTKDATHVAGSLSRNAELSKCIATLLQPTSNSLAYTVFSIFGVVSCPSDRVNDRRALFGMRNKNIFQVFDSLCTELDHGLSLEGAVRIPLLDVARASQHISLRQHCHCLQ
jgi:hypothetical protein